MKKEITISIKQCDYCTQDDRGIVEAAISTCWMCGKDFCNECGSDYDGEQGTISLCNSCYEKLYDKAEKAGLIGREQISRNDWPGKIKQMKENAVKDRENLKND